MSFGEIVLWVIFGGLAGWIASIIVSKVVSPNAVGSNQRLGLVGNIIVGVVGAFIGGAILPHDADRFDVGSFIAAIVGAVLLLVVVNWLMRLANRNGV